MNKLSVNIKRLSSKIKELAQVGALDGGGVSRLALTDNDKQARDLVISWMNKLGLNISIDKLGNVVAIRTGIKNTPPVIMGSHIDTVSAAGPYDGCLGVLAGIEVIETLNDNNIATEIPVAVAFFTNEEGSRFQPDMMGSLVYQGDLNLETALSTVGIDGTTVEENLKRIGYIGNKECGNNKAHAYFELHIEQGPILEEKGINIGVVECVQGISWTEITIEGISSHAGGTPMYLRHDAGYAAGCITQFVRQIAKDIGENQVSTVGYCNFSPNLVNVIADKIVMTVDLRNTNEEKLQEAEKKLNQYIQKLADEEGVKISTRVLARFKPEYFNPEMVDLVESTARELNYTTYRMPSGAGHDAQILSRICPAAMIFVPSEKGISHNTSEFTSEDDIEKGANTLLNVVLNLSSANLKLSTSSQKINC